MPRFSKIANGTIRPSRFVKLDTTAEGTVLECNAGDRCFGIAQQGTRNTPYGSLDDGNAAISGEILQIYGPPELDVPLELGGTVDEGDYIKADADGKGVKAGTDADEYGAMCLRGGVSGEIVPVQATTGERAS